MVSGNCSDELKKNANNSSNDTILSSILIAIRYQNEIPCTFASNKSINWCGWLKM